MWKRRNRNRPSSDAGKTNIHHKIPKQYWGSNHSDNLVEMKVIPHRGLHYLFDNHVFHQQVIDLINLMWPTVNKIMTDDIKDVIQSYSVEDMYNQDCANMDKLIHWINKTRND